MPTVVIRLRPASMPTLVITGHPSCGKSRFARVLAERALALPPTDNGADDTTSTGTTAISTVVLISEETACPGRTKAECYADSRAEKGTREALKSTFDRYCTSSGGGGSGSGGGGGSGGSGIVLRRKDPHGNTSSNGSSGNNGSEGRLVILDSLNYIKGFRYEIHCIARASGQRHGVVWVLNDPDRCLEWNDQRRRRRRRRQNNNDDDSKEKKGDGAGGSGEDNSTAAVEEDWYQSDDMIRELMRRYEPPDERNRWDKPLYRADIGSMILPGSNDGQGTAPPPTAAATTTTSSTTKDEGAAASSPADPDQGDGRAKNTSSSANAVLSRTLYDMHCLTEAIGGDGASTATNTGAAPTDARAAAQQNHNQPASKSFKRSAAAGFKRNKARSATAAAASASKGKSTATGASLSEGLAISKLTPEALESLDASNGRNAGGGSTVDGGNASSTCIGNQDHEEDANNGMVHVRQSAKEVGGGNNGTDKDNGTQKEPATLEELADSILKSFLGKDVAPLKEGKSTALLVNAGANVSQVKSSGLLFASCLRLCCGLQASRFPSSNGHLPLMIFPYIINLHPIPCTL